MTTELLLALYVVSTWIVKLRRRVFSKFESSKDEGNFTKELIKVKRYSRLRNVLNGCSLLKPLEWSTVPPEKPQPCVCVSGCQGPIFRSEAWASAPPLSLAHPLQVLLHKTPLSSFLYMGEGLSSNWISLFVWLFLLVCSYTPHLSVCLFFSPPSPHFPSFFSSWLSFSNWKFLIRTHSQLHCLVLEKSSSGWDVKHQIYTLKA